MKKISFLLLAAIAIFDGCKKSSSGSASNNNTNTTTPQYSNTIAVTDNGTLHKATETWDIYHNPGLKVYMVFIPDTGSYGSTCALTVNDTSFDFSMDIDGQYGPPSGIGKYTKPTYLSTDSYTAKYNSNKVWGMDSFQINVVSVLDNIVAGNFTLWMATATEKKTVTGTFSCYK